jgi:hypothetical protein
MRKRTSSFAIAFLSALGAWIQLGCSVPPEGATTILYQPSDYAGAAPADLPADERQLIDDICGNLSHLKPAEVMAKIKEAQQGPCSTDLEYELHLLEAIALAEQKRTTEALRLLDTAIQAKETDWRPYLHRWQLRLRAGDDEGAEQDRRAGAALNPSAFEVNLSPVGGVI